MGKVHLNESLFDIYIFIAKLCVCCCYIIIESRFLRVFSYEERCYNLTLIRWLLPLYFLQKYKRLILRNIFCVFFVFFSSFSISKEFKESVIEIGDSKRSDYIAMFNISYEDENKIINQNFNVFVQSAISESFTTCDNIKLCTSSILVIPVKNDEVFISYSLNAIKQNGSIGGESKIIFKLNEDVRLYSNQITTNIDDTVSKSASQQNVTATLRIIKNKK